MCTTTASTTTSGVTGCALACSVVSAAQRSSLAHCTLSLDKTKCLKDCSTIQLEGDCRRNEACEFDLASAKCLKKCALRYDATTEGRLQCTRDSACRLTDAGTCDSKTCSVSAFRDQASCEQDPQCVFVAGACAMRPCAYTTAEACGLDGGCVWNATITGTSSRCFQNVCYDKTTQATCNANPIECEYQCTDNKCKCALRTCRSTSPALCDAVSGCLYNTTQSRCVDRPKDCQYSEWITVTACSAQQQCSNFHSVQRREVVLEALAGGKQCDASALEQTVPCGTVACTCEQMSSSALVCMSKVGCEYASGTCRSSSIDNCSASTSTSGCPSGCQAVGTDVSQTCLPKISSCDATATSVYKCRQLQVHEHDVFLGCVVHPWPGTDEGHQQCSDIFHCDGHPTRRSHGRHRQRVCAWRRSPRRHSTELEAVVRVEPCLGHDDVHSQDPEHIDSDRLEASD